MLTILFVEDDGPSRDGFVRYLSTQGHRVLEAWNGEEAVAMASRETFDVVFMDVRMPKLDGVSACRRIRQAQPKTKVVLISGYHADEDLHRLASEPDVKYLRKPITHHALVEAMEQLGLSSKTAPEAKPGDGSGSAH